ncbi:hypothetical protein QF010_004066 [Pseudomonas silensiensis]
MFRLREQARTHLTAFSCGSGLAREEVGSSNEDQPLRTRKLRHNAATINTLTSAQPQAC